MVLTRLCEFSTCDWISSMPSSSGCSRLACCAHSMAAKRFFLAPRPCAWASAIRALARRAPVVILVHQRTQIGAHAFPLFLLGAVVAQQHADAQPRQRVGARLLACAVKQAQNLVQARGARNPVRLRRCCDRPCCTWPAASLLPPRAAATGRAPRRPGSCPACCRGSPGGCRTCCWPRPPRGGPPAAGSGNSLAHGRRHPTAWRPPPRR